MSSIRLKYQLHHYWMYMGANDNLCNVCFIHISGITLISARFGNDCLNVCYNRIVKAIRALRHERSLWLVKRLSRSSRYWWRYSQRSVESWQQNDRQGSRSNGWRLSAWIKCQNDSYFTAGIPRSRVSSTVAEGTETTVFLEMLTIIGPQQRHWLLKKF